MIRTVHIDINAANPNMPLAPSDPFVGSAVSFTICNVPRSFGKREITGVAVNVTNVSGQTAAFAATRVGSAWGATVPASAVGGSGVVQRGIIVSASGTDETGAAVEAWILGAGDLVVREQDGTVTPGTAKRVMHWFDERPANPVAGDVAPYNGAVYYFNGTAWVAFGGGSVDAYTKEETNSLLAGKADVVSVAPAYAISSVNPWRPSQYYSKGQIVIYVARGGLSDVNTGLYESLVDYNQRHVPEDDEDERYWKPRYSLLNIIQEDYAKKADVPTLAAPSEASTDAQAAKAKATYEFVNSSINAMAAFYITKNAAGDSFATKAELNAAITSGTFYNGGQLRTPTKNDYLYVLADESHPTAAGTSPTTRYSFDGTQWAFQIVVNDTALTEAQLAAMNSGINAALVAWLAAFKGNDTATTLASVLAAIAGKANKNGDDTVDFCVKSLSSDGAVLAGGEVVGYGDDGEHHLSLKADRAAFAPDYSSSQTYLAGEFVFHNGVVYQCDQANGPTDPHEPTGGTTDAYWHVAKLDDFFKESNTLLTGRIGALTKANASEATTDAIALPDGGVVSASSSAPTITFGTARQAGGLRFCELYITNPDTAADGAIVSISGKVYSDVSLSDLPKLEKGATYYFTFAEFKVTQETVEGETVNVSHWKVSKQKLDAMGGDIPTPTVA